VRIFQWKHLYGYGIEVKMVVEDSHLAEFVGCMRGARLDIMSQMGCYQTATGEQKEAYKRVLLDKLWKVSQLCGEFYYEVLSGIFSLERQTFGEVREDNEVVVPQFWKQYARWRQQMRQLEQTLPELAQEAARLYGEQSQPSDTASAETTNAP
jgi:hypothetical protein